MDAFAIDDALETIWELVRRLNRYVEETQPWALAKQGDDAALDRALATLTAGVRVLAGELEPWLPTSMARLQEALGDGTTVEKLEPLFPKVDRAAAA
jgi:methionyl-tRNA synthetase